MMVTTLLSRMSYGAAIIPLNCLFAGGKIWWGTPTGVDRQISPKGWFVAGDGDHSSESDEPWRCNNPPVPCIADISFLIPSANNIFYSRRVVQLRA